VVVACVTRTPGVGAAAEADGNTGADSFRRFLRCAALDPRGLSQGPYAPVFAAVAFTVAVGLAQLTAVAGLWLRVQGRVLRVVFQCRRYYAKILERRGVASLVAKKYAAPPGHEQAALGKHFGGGGGGPGGGQGTPGRPGLGGAANQTTDWETMSEGARAKVGSRTSRIQLTRIAWNCLV
jgi:uncharacterized membrane protein YgcG